MKRNFIMFNATTNYEYTGKNEATLSALGFTEEDSFVTFKQAIKLPGITGKQLKGIKKAASLVRYSKTEKEQDETGQMRAKPIYFSVFHIDDVMDRSSLGAVLDGIRANL